MQSHNRSASKSVMTFLVVAAALAIMLLAAALMQRKIDAPPGWTAIGGQLDRSLNRLESGGRDRPVAKQTASQAGESRRGGAAADRGAASSPKKPEEVKPEGPQKGTADSGSSAGTAAGGNLGTNSGQPLGNGKIDINRATAAELDVLPGIGAAKAKTIVDDRKKNGPFRSANDLLRVKGIGPKLLEKIKPVIVAGQ